MIWWLVPATLAVAGCLACLGMVRRRNLQYWIGSYIASRNRRRPRRQGEETHLIFCLADHYEPKWGGASAEAAQSRVETWTREYPKQFARFPDSDGRPPRYTFFFPLEEYDAGHIDALTELCRLGFGEVEVHLHHDNDTPEALRAKLQEFKKILAERHGQLARNRVTGELAYGFIHGNWALDNSRPDGKWCGVNNELDILRETGCYADFTLPSAPSNTQTKKINSIYYAVDDPLRPKSHNDGVELCKEAKPPNSLLMIQGPLLLDWHRRKGILPRVENGCIQGNQPPSLDRLKLWLKARVQVPTRPDWFFVKIYTHGAPEANHDVLLGSPMIRFHESLAEWSGKDSHFHYHYVTAREMYNLVRAAEAGWKGSVKDALDFELTWNGRDALVAVAR